MVKELLSYFPDPIAVLDGGEDGEVDAPPVAIIVQTPVAFAKAKRLAAIPAVASGARGKSGPKPKTAMDVAVDTQSF